jgi:hypothetical protein
MEDSCYCWNFFGYSQYYHDIELLAAPEIVTIG